MARVRGSATGRGDARLIGLQLGGSADDSFLESVRELRSTIGRNLLARLSSDKTCNRD
jgi:hypothetical protein